MTRQLFAFATLALASFVTAAQPLDAAQRRAFEIYRELVEINTVTATGDTARAADAMAARLLAAGFPPEDVKVFKPAPRKGNLVARLRGTGKSKPIMLMAHIDVVEARREDWSTDPFKLVEKDGYYYARGATDDKFMAATWIANLIRYQARKVTSPTATWSSSLETRRGNPRQATASASRWLLDQPARAHRRGVRAQRRRRRRRLRDGKGHDGRRADEREGLP